MMKKKDRYFIWGLTLFILGVLVVFSFIILVIIYDITDVYLVPTILSGLFGLLFISIGSIIVNKTLE